MTIEARVLVNKDELQKYLQKFNKEEFQIIYDMLMESHYSKEFAEELKYNFFANDEETIVDNRYVSINYKTVSERFFEEYYCGIATFIVIEPDLYVSFNIPSVKSIVYEIEFPVNYSNPFEDAYVEFDLKEKTGMNFDLLNNKITIEQ